MGLPRTQSLAALSHPSALTLKAPDALLLPLLFARVEEEGEIDRELVRFGTKALHGQQHA